jgi:hypothetical protein
LVRCPCGRTIGRWAAPHLGLPAGPGPVYCESGTEFIEPVPDVPGLYVIRCSGGKLRKCGQSWHIHVDQLEALIVSAARDGRSEVFMGRDTPRPILPRGRELLGARGLALMQATASELGVDVSAVVACVDAIAADTDQLVDPRDLVPLVQYLREHRDELAPIVANG